MKTIKLTCDTCNIVHEVSRTQEIPDNVISLSCNWCPDCEENMKNRIEILGTKEQVKEVVEKFATLHPKSLDRTRDGTEIICTDNDNKFKGWYNDKTDEFTYCGKQEEKIKGLPENIKYRYTEAFLQFPNFDKVFKMPIELKGLEPHMGIVTAVHKKYDAKISGNPLIATMELLSRERQTMQFEGKDKDIFEKCCIAYEKTGFAYWHDWNVEHWGTKWNSYACDKESDNVYLFETVWNGVPRIMEEISKKFPDVKFIYEYSDEDTGNNCGIVFYENGVNTETKLENSSKEAYDLAFKLRPDNKKYYELIDGNYEYKDEDED